MRDPEFAGAPRSPRSTARSQAGKARPSSRVDDGRGALALRRLRPAAAPSTRPLRRCVAYWATRHEPVRGQPLRFGEDQRAGRSSAPSPRRRRRAAARASTLARARRRASGVAISASASSTLSAISERDALVRLGRDAGDVRRQDQVRAIGEHDCRRRAARPRTRRARRRRAGRSSTPRPARPRRRCRRGRC